MSRRSMKRREFLYRIALGLSSVQASTAWGHSHSSPPNLLLILVDDQSWNGLSIPMSRHITGSSSSFLDTPAIAGLAAQGMRFSQAYAPSPHCAPTRISLQTGKTPARLRWTKNGPSRSGCELIPPPSRRTMQPSEITLAKRLRASGYATAHFGKWGLKSRGPEAHGYDESDGNTKNRDVKSFKPPNPADIFGITERAIRFMEKMQRAGRPFFAQLSHYAVQYAKYPLPRTVDKYRSRLPGQPEDLILTAAITENLDTSIDQLLRAMDAMDLLDNTYIIYTSDNGGRKKIRWESPLRGGKGSLFEGGIRVPFIVRGPGVKHNTFCDEPVCGYDLFPTIIKLALDEEPSSDQAIDGGDLSHLLSGATGPVTRSNEGLLFHFPHYYKKVTPQSALRTGDLKLIKYYEEDRIRLFDIVRDPGETQDLSSTHAALADELHELLIRTLTTMNAALPSRRFTYGSVS